MKYAAAWHYSLTVIEEVTILAFLMEPAYSLEGWSGRVNVEPTAVAVIRRSDGMLKAVPVSELQIMEVRASL